MRSLISCISVGVCLVAASYAQPYLPVPGNLKAEGVPPVPLSLVETLAQYNESRTAVLQDWHPLNREILITTRFGDVAQVHRVGMPMGARTQLTFFPERVSGARYRPKTGDAFLFSKDTGGGEWYQIFLYDGATGQSRMLTDGKSRNIADRWSTSGRLISFSSTKRNRRDLDIYVMDPSDPQSTRMVLEVEGGGWAAVDWSPDDRTLLVGEYKSVNETHLYLVDVASGKKEPLTPPGERAAYSSAAFSKDGKGIYVATDKESEFHRLAYLDLASRKLIFLRPDLKWDVSSIALSADGRFLAYTLNENGAESLHIMDLSNRRELRIPQLALGGIGSVRWHANSRELGFSLASAKSPADVYSIDVTKRTLERWTRSETGGLNPEAFLEPELIQWKSFDGRMISGFLYPAARKFSGPRPVIIDIHGGPEGQSTAGFRGRTNFYMNELGVAVIYPNVRGSTGYGKSFLNLDNGYQREDSVKDVGALLDWIVTRPDLDSKRVMVTGGSYGGYMTLASMTHFNERLRCAVDIVGISNWVTFLTRTEAYRRDLRRVEYGDERDPKMKEFLVKVSPLTGVSKITKPMFIVQGKNDPRVPYTESEQMVAAIRANGGPVWYLLAEDEGHGFAKKRNADFQFAATVMFVKKYLLE